MEQRPDAVRQDGTGEWIARPLGQAQCNGSQQAADRCWIGLRQIVASRAKGILEQPQQLLVRIDAELVGLAEAQLRRRAALQQQPVIEEECEPCEGQWRLACEQINHGGMKVRDRGSAGQAPALRSRSVAMAAPVRGRMGITARSSSPWCGSRRLRPRCFSL